MDNKGHLWPHTEDLFHLYTEGFHRNDRIALHIIHKTLKGILDEAASTSMSGGNINYERMIALLVFNMNKISDLKTGECR